MKRTTRTQRFLAVSLTMAMSMSACGSDADEAGGADGGLFDGGSATTVADGSTSGNGVRSDDDAEGVFANGTPSSSGGAATTEALDDDAYRPPSTGALGNSASDGEAAGANGSAQSRTADSDAEGGLFGASEPTPPTDDLEEDNTFEDYGVRDFVDTDRDPFSTFALDVDTGSYNVVRRHIDEGIWPPAEAVRVEELLNAFDYEYDAPRRGLDVVVDGGPSPFDDDNYLVRIGVQGMEVDEDERRPAALTFVVDTSGSMDREDRLGLVKESLEILVDELDADDTVAIVTYDNSAGVVLQPTAVRERGIILDAIDNLRPGGSTNLEAGLRQGYGLASEAFREGGINRVILASDGVANVGVTDPDALAALIRDDADRGVQLVTVGFGLGNFNDTVMEQLADQGDGFYAYVDTEDEARRLFEDELTSTLVTVAIDAKIQVEFDDEVVEAYRLIGFENRGVRDSDFRNDAVDAGEIGAGHQVTAIYEVELARGVNLDDRGDLGQVMLRWEDPDTGDVIEIDEDIDMRDLEGEWADTEESLQLATVVASYAEVMRQSPFADDIDLDQIEVEAQRLAELFDDDLVDDFADLVADTIRLR